MSTKSPFTSNSICIVFAYAPAGLGHLRVTDALRHGLPEDAQPILLPESSESIRWIHRLTSRNPMGKRLMEWAQYGRAEDIVTRVYRRMLKRDARYLEVELLRILKQRVVLPEKLLVVATHFGLAHQLSTIKKSLERKAQVKIIIAMQVTDDSPQKIWYVPDLDLITVPSEQTKHTLVSYGKSERLNPSKLVVLPYPLSPHLGEDLLPVALRHRRSQYNESSNTPINVSIPISGAAVGTSYAEVLMRELHKHSKRFVFHVVTKKTLYTDMFLMALSRKPYIEVSSSHSDREIVELYEQVYDRVVLSLEVTKPSEQAFKAMFSPKQSGGVILLFAAPVGRQEYDNLHFLERHGLIPNEVEQAELLSWSQKNWKLNDHEKKRLFASTAHWRGMCIPTDPIQAAQFILWGIREGFFASLSDALVCSRGDILCREEVASDGVAKFWKEVEKIL
ncbi:MAG: hypothetical protein ABI758_02405 [Candidatus Woesebacteria bacterium]